MLIVLIDFDFIVVVGRALLACPSHVRSLVVIIPRRIQAGTAVPRRPRIQVVLRTFILVLEFGWQWRRVRYLHGDFLL